jgi:hypothetical protein
MPGEPAAAGLGAAALGAAALGASEESLGG